MLKEWIVAELDQYWPWIINGILSWWCVSWWIWCIVDDKLLVFGIALLRIYMNLWQHLDQWCQSVFDSCKKQKTHLSGHEEISLCCNYTVKDRKLNSRLIQCKMHSEVQTKLMWELSSLSSSSKVEHFKVFFSMKFPICVPRAVILCRNVAEGYKLVVRFQGQKTSNKPTQLLPSCCGEEERLQRLITRSVHIWLVSIVLR